MCGAGQLHCARWAQSSTAGSSCAAKYLEVSLTPPALLARISSGRAHSLACRPAHFQVALFWFPCPVREKGRERKRERASERERERERSTPSGRGGGILTQDTRLRNRVVEGARRAGDRPALVARGSRGTMFMSIRDRLRVSGRGTTRAEDAQGTPTKSHISPSVLVYEENDCTSLSSLPGLVLKVSLSRSSEKLGPAGVPRS